MTKTAPFEFLCLSRDLSQRRVIERVLGREGRVDWILLRPIGLRRYEEAREVAERALPNAPNQPSGWLMRTFKLWHLRAQYAGARRLFQRRRSAVAVAWGASDGGRMAFMEGARAAGAQRLYLELAPLPGRITVDPCGVNALCSLPRTLEPYLAWADQHAPDRKAWRAARSDIRQRTASRPRVSDDGLPSLDEPFLFVPLQVPKDTQVRLLVASSRASMPLFQPLRRQPVHYPMAGICGSRNTPRPRSRSSKRSALPARPGSGWTMTPTRSSKWPRLAGWSRSIPRLGSRRSISTSRWWSAERPSGPSPELPHQRRTWRASRMSLPRPRHLVLMRTLATPS